MISAIVLAAGRSVRMGQQKLLLPIGDKPMIAGIVDEVLRSPIDTITLVVGPDSTPVRDVVQGGNRAASTASRIVFITNSDPTGDMLSSVRCGLRALPPDCEGVL